jgi:hypothetical protein
MFRLAKDLGSSVKDIMKMSNAEFVAWAAFYKMEAEEHKQAMNQAKARRR